MRPEDALDIVRPLGRRPLTVDTEVTYLTKEKAESALRRGGWVEKRDVWSRRGNTEIATVRLFEGRYKISVEVVDKSDFLSWEGL